MPRPGTEVRIVDGAASGAAILDTGQAFFVGASGRGSAERAVRVSSLADYQEKFGARSDGSLLYDAVRCFFSEGGGSLYVSRVVADDADASTVAFGANLTATAASPGTWGNDLTVTAEDPIVGTGRVIKVYLDDELVDQSPTLADRDAAIAWSEGRAYVEFSALGAGTTLPAAGTSVDLASGANGAATDADDVTAALARFEYGLGPGQVAAPGFTTTPIHEALLAHADANRRVVLIDLPDSADEAALVAALEAIQDTAGIRYSLVLAPWIEYPGEASGATVTVPFSGIQAGLIARADTATGNPNESAAGVNGIHRMSTGLSAEFADDVREGLNALGITLAKVKYGTIRTYGYRTGAGASDPNWLWYGNSRTLMAIAHACDAAAENYVLRQIDGKRVVLSALETDLRGVLLPYFNQGALFGETPADAFSVDVGPGVNTVETIAAGEVHAVIRAKFSPAGEWVRIDVVKVPIEAALAA